MRTTWAGLTEVIRDAATPLAGNDCDFDPLLERIGDTHYVLIGEATHGTHEFYRLRAQLTKRLIREKGFTAVAVEADWPDAYRINRYVRGRSDDNEAIDALAGFERFPTWMWRNADVLDFVGWLREHNDRAAQQCGFYGLDLYSLFDSIQVVLDFLDKTNPDHAKLARQRYGCFESFQGDSQAYGYAASLDLDASCRDAVVRQLVDIQKRRVEYLQNGSGRDDFFDAEMNARLIRNAERYYREMFHGRVSTWNMRDIHMSETLRALIKHLRRKIQNPKVVVWAHNSHLGDARATDMGAVGELNLGQLVREDHGRDAVLVGFSTYSGTVTAASDWSAPAQRMRVLPGLEGSYEALFHSVGEPNFMLIFGRDPEADQELRQARLERAIGVIYRPDTERFSHYFHARLADQFDAVLHLDEARAVEPLERSAHWETGEAPETFPFAV